MRQEQSDAAVSTVHSPSLQPGDVPPSCSVSEGLCSAMAPLPVPPLCPLLPAASCVLWNGAAAHPCAHGRRPVCEVAPSRAPQDSRCSVGMAPTDCWQCCAQTAAATVGIAQLGPWNSQAVGGLLPDGAGPASSKRCCAQASHSSCVRPHCASSLRVAHGERRFALRGELSACSTAGRPGQHCWVKRVACGAACLRCAHQAALLCPPSRVVQPAVIAVLQELCSASRLLLRGGVVESAGSA